MATGRKFENLTKDDLLLLQAILENYAVKCGEMADSLQSKTFRTDGFTTIKKGLFALRNLLAKQLGQQALSEFPIVATWVFRKNKVTPILLTAAESPPIYDVSQGNPSMKAQAKAIKKLRPKSKRKKPGTE